MIKQPLHPNSTMPNRPHIYYPIETKKNHTTSPPQPPPRPERTKDKQEGPRREREVEGGRREREVDALRRQNEEFREREEIYIDKLMKLQEGLENQHSEFIKLQELYTELFESYKQKEAEIIDLEMKFRESDRYSQQERQAEGERGRDTVRSDSRVKEYSFREKQWSSRQQQWQAKEEHWNLKQKQWGAKQKEMGQYIDSLNKRIGNLSENYERMVQQMSQLKGKERTSSRAHISQKTLEDIQQWQNEVNSEKQIRLKFQYENQFLKSRNADLQSQREELENLLAYKQKQINKLREEKIKIHRQSSQKSIQRSPAKAGQSRVGLRASNVLEKEGQRQVQVCNASGSMDSSNNHYFSFSKDKQEYSIDSELPSFPPELEIDSIITEHKK